MSIFTEWFPKGVKPTREGVYEVADEGDYSLFLLERFQWYAYWNGKRFCYRASDVPAHAFESREYPTDLPALTKWRGLAKEPK
ncbi:hypothetical protein [Paraburkholderia sp. J11-2]|uniref:hypothetical protein n=1 Tax=Paraburkholderia sp. J11-2 TaxID=2805431 RepID=UPI002AB69928|nr:hypothetical protein [Paraburkholderia sp. J11-2]